MSLINEQQKKNAGDNQSPVKIPVPKPAPQQAPAQSFAPAPQPTTESSYEPINQAPVEFFEEPLKEAQSAPPASPFNLAEAVRPGASTEQRAPVAEPADMTPYMPGTNLWQDVTEQQPEGFQINLPNDVATKKPTLFNPLQVGPDIAGAQANQLFTQVGNNFLTRQQAADVARVSAANAAVAQKRTQLKNTPELDKPWHESAWSGITGYLGEVLFGSEAAQKETSGVDPNKPARFNPFIGLLGRHGAGAGGYLKYALSAPLSVIPVGYSALADEAIKRKQKRMEEENPAVLYNGKYISFSQLPESAKRERAGRAFNNSWVGKVFPNFYTEREFDAVKAISDVITGQVVGDDTNDANPYLQPWNDKSKAEPPKGFLFSGGRRPGQPWYKDPKGTAWELANQILSPGNKVDIVGNAIGAVVGKSFGTVGGMLFGNRNFVKNADEALAILKTPGSTRELAENVAGSSGKRVQNAPELELPNTPSKPPSQLTPAPEIKVTPPARSAISEPINLPGARPSNPFDDDAFNFSEVLPEPSGSTFSHPAVVPDIYKQKPIVPRSSTVEVIENAGVLQPGKVIEFTPTTLPRTHDDVIAFMKSGTPEQQEFLRGYKGADWGDLQEYVRLKNPERAGEFNSIGSILDAFPNTKPKLDDLLQQSTDLAANRNLLEQAKEVVQEYFEKTVDYGRRAIDDLPASKLTVEEVEKTIAAGGKVKFAAGTLEDGTLAPEITKALQENNPVDIEELVSPEVIEGLVAKNNEILRPEPRITELREGLVSTVKPPKVVFHGTAIAGWTPDYNVIESGSRGIFGSGLYTSQFLNRAGDYAGAFTGENASVISKAKELAPSVVELNTEAFVATLSAEKLLSKEVVETFAKVFPEAKIPIGARRRLKTLTSLIEKSLTKNASEADLQSAYTKVSNVLRDAGYDSVYSKKTGDFVAIDNQKLKFTRRYNVEPPTGSTSDAAMEAAVKRFNVDSAEAAAHPDHLTAASNLADSQHKLLDQMSAQVDDKLSEVQAAAIKKISNTEPEPVTAIQKTTTKKSVMANNLGKGDVESAKALFKTYSNALELPIMQKDGDRWIVYGNKHTLEAAQELRKRFLDVVVRTKDGSSSIERINTSSVVNVSYAEVQEQLPKTLEQTQQMYKRDGMLEFPPVYKENSKGDLVVVQGYEFASDVAASAGKPYEAVVIRKGRARVLELDGNGVISHPVEQTFKEAPAKKTPKTKTKAKAKTTTKADVEVDKSPEAGRKRIQQQLSKKYNRLADLESKQYELRKQSKSTRSIDRAIAKVEDEIDSLTNDFDALGGSKAPTVEEVDDFVNKYADDYEPTDEEIMRMSEYEDFAEEAPFNPEEHLDELLASLDDGTICRY